MMSLTFTGDSTPGFGGTRETRRATIAAAASCLRRSRPGGVVASLRPAGPGFMSHSRYAATARAESCQAEIASGQWSKNYCRIRLVADVTGRAFSRARARLDG